MLADYLNADLRRIADSANEKLYAISRSELSGEARQAAETRVITAAREFAKLRVESTVRQLRERAGQPVIAPVEVTESASDAVNAEPAEARVESAAHVEPEAEPEPEAAAEAQPQSEPEPEPAEQRLRRLLAFVARQEPRLRWAVGVDDGDDTVLVTDLAHGWIPAGIELPAGVRLLAPGRRTGTAAELLGVTTHTASYAPTDRLGRASEFAPTETSGQPRELPSVGDVGTTLAEATHGRDGLPRLVNNLAKAAAAGIGAPDSEIDLLRVHLDTAQYQLLAQYPHVDAALLLNCLLLAATAALVTRDTVSANYHTAWFQALSGSTDNHK